MEAKDALWAYFRSPQGSVEEIRLSKAFDKLFAGRCSRTRERPPNREQKKRDRSWDKNNLAKRSVLNKRWKAENPASLKASQKKYVANNRGKVNQWKYAWVRKNRAKVNASQRRRRSLR